MFLLAGVRYDRLQAVIKLPPPLAAFLTPYEFRIDVDLNSVFPYLGMEYRLESPQSSIKTYAKVSPIALQIGRDAPDSAYYLQTGLEYAVRPYRNVSVSAFGRLDLAHAVFTKASNIGGILQSPLPLPGPLPIDQDLTVHWKQISIGGSLSMAFSLPDFL
jgi:hypothetical protein